jgi:Tol biopolymer transport system component
MFYNLSMRIPPSVYRFLRSAFFILHLSSFILLLAACAPISPTIVPLSTESSLFVFDYSTSSLLEYSSDFAIQREIPLNLPCPLTGTHPPPRGPRLALELECINGPLVQIVDTDTGKVTTPFSDVDSHFLAWDVDGNVHLRVDSLGNARLVRVTPNGDEQQFDLPAQTYDMDFAPDGQTLFYSFKRGLGLGSELWAADSAGGRARQLHADADSVITFARWSPDGKQIIFIKLPDSATPFPRGELWIMDADGSHARPLAPADAGHGYAAAWSPDSTRIAFVGRDNPEDPAADQSVGALVSNLYIVDIASGGVTSVTRFEGTLVEAPLWSANGHFLAFSVVSLDDTINVWLADLDSGAVTPLENRGPACCPAWIRK